MPDHVPAAVVQSEVPSTLAAGLERLEVLTADAAAGRAQLVVLPETWLPAYPAWLDVCRDAALWNFAPVKTVYRRMAEESVVVPSAATDASGRLARR
jgi:nitrilase